MGDYIKFTPARASPSGKTQVWDVSTTVGPGMLLGRVSWYGPWRRYTFYALAGTVYDAMCLQRLATFCEDATQRHRLERVIECVEACVGADGETVGGYVRASRKRKRAG